MELVSERELVKLLAEFQNTNLADKAGKDDYAFLQETIFPTLLPALVHLSEHLEAQGVVPPPAGYKIEARGAEQASAGSSQKVNPQRWLAEHLVRHHPAGQVFKHDSAYAEHLNKIAKGRKEQRVERERLVIEQQRTVEEEQVRQELERTKEEEARRVEDEAARKKQVEEKLVARDLAGEAAVKEAAPPAHLPLIVDFRSTCMAKVDAFDFDNADSTAELVAGLYTEAVVLLATNSNASFTAIGDLVDADTVWYHTAADKKEFLLEDEDEPEDGSEVVKKEPPAPEITTRALPGKDDETAYIIRRGHGITLEEVVDSAKAKYCSDAKYVEGMFFFEDKRPGTFLAVPIVRGGAVVGVLCADTLDSIAGSELTESEVTLYQAVLVALNEAIVKADWCLMTAICKKHDAKIRTLAAHPATLPALMAEAVVNAISEICPSGVVSLGVVDTDTDLRLVLHREEDGTRTCDRTVTPAVSGEHVSLMFKVREKCVEQTTELPHAMAVPILDATTGVAPVATAVLYVSCETPLSEDLVEFIRQIAHQLVPVMLAPSPSAMRTLKILASSGTGGDASDIYQAAAMLCARHVNGSSVLIGMAHGADELRIVQSPGGNGPKLHAVVSRSEVPACKEAMRAQALSLQGQHVAIPLVLTRGSSTIPFGVIAMVVPGGDVQLDALPGIASALASALAGSQWRRKLKACGMEGLASLLKRAPNIKGAYLAFPDVGGRQVCAGVIGEEVSSHVQTGKLVEDTTGLQVTAIQAEGGPILGYIGVNEAGVKVSDDEGDSDAWEVMKDVGWTLATVSGVIEAQGALFDKSGEEALRSEEALASHFNAARFKLVTATTIAAVSLPYMDSVKVASQPALGVVAIMQGIMYILGHQHRDVSEWPKCRKLITHHIFKEMKMIDVRVPLKEHKLKLAKECIKGLTPTVIRSAEVSDKAVGEMPLALWRWVVMVLDVQGL